MSRTSHRLVVVAVVIGGIALALAVTAVSRSSTNSQTSFGGATVASVGSETVSSEMVEAVVRYQRAVVRLTKQPYRLSQTGARRQALSILVQSAIQRIEASARGIRVSEKMVDARIEAIKAQHYGGSDSRYDAELGRLNLRLDDVRAAVRAELTSQLLEEAVLREAGSQTRAAHISHAWFADVIESHCSLGVITYRAHYTPLPDPCA